MTILARARLWLTRLLYTLWFVPSLMVVASALLAVWMIELSARIDDDVLARWPRLFGATAGSSRDMLVAIASSIITVAGVTFSITMVAVTQVSNQYTPRILRNFMRDRQSQIVLGGLAGVFTYCLIVLRTIRSSDDSPFLPSVAVLGGVVLGAMGVGLLIFFVHHIASSLQASSIISRVAADTIGAVDLLFPAEVAAPRQAPRPLPALRVDASLDWQPVVARATGYLQHVDADGLVRTAVRHDVVIRMECAVGDFVMAGMPLASVTARNGVELAPVWRSVIDAYQLGTYRTIEQDPGFGVRQLADIALKALSPGINDPTTALNAIDYIGAVLARAASRESEAHWRAANGQVRVIAQGPTFQSLTTSGLDEVRRYGEGKPAVLFRLLDCIGVIARETRDPERRRHLAMHVELIRECVERTVPAPSDRGALLVRSGEIADSLERSGAA